MSIPWNSPWRGCAANFPQPLSAEDLLAAQFLVETVYYFNCRIIRPPLAAVEYRSSSREADILSPVYRWDLTPHDDVFQNGFEARRQQGTSDNIYFNLDHYVHHAGRPLDSRRPATHAFVSTTLSCRWCPSVNRGEQREVYRYEIYAPGGIWVAETLGDSYQFPAQEEVCFVAGIAPQYIRSAQRFLLSGLYTPDRSRETMVERIDDELIYNENFNPQSDVAPAQQRRIRRSVREKSEEEIGWFKLNIQRPVFDCIDKDGQRVPLTITYYKPDAAASGRNKRQVSDSSDAIQWYAKDVADSESYITAAFRSSRTNEAYLFMMNEYVLVDYAPGSTDDKVLNGPLLICDGFPSLIDTTFGEHGIDCAFRSHSGDEAFIFSRNLCAVVNYAPHTTDDEITRGPMTIAAMLPFLKGTIFESGVDAAFESTTESEAYLFKDDQYALINYGSDSQLIAVRPIADGFASLKNTIFEGGIDAAFASHRYNEAYIFKGKSYALINFAPGTTDDYIINGPKEIIPSWPSLSNILPRKNRGLDVHIHSKPEADRDHDEL